MFFNIKPAVPGRDLLVQSLDKTVQFVPGLFSEDADIVWKNAHHARTNGGGVAMVCSTGDTSTKLSYVKSSGEALDWPADRSAAALQSYVEESIKGTERMGFITTARIELNSSMTSLKWKQSIKNIVTSRNDNDDLLYNAHKTAYGDSVLGISQDRFYMGTSFDFTPIHVSDSCYTASHSLFKFDGVDREVDGKGDGGDKKFLHKNNLFGCKIHLIFTGSPEQLVAATEGLWSELPDNLKAKLGKKDPVELLISPFFSIAAGDEMWRYYIQEPGTQVLIDHPHSTISVGTLVAGYKNVLPLARIKDVYQSETDYRSAIRGAVLNRGISVSSELLEKISAKTSPMIYNMIGDAAASGERVDLLVELLDDQRMDQWSLSKWMVDAYSKHHCIRDQVDSAMDGASGIVTHACCNVCGRGIEVGFLNTKSSLAAVICVDCSMDPKIQELFPASEPILTADGVNFMRNLYIKQAPIEPDAFALLNSLEQQLKEKTDELVSKELAAEKNNDELQQLQSKFAEASTSVDQYMASCEQLQKEMDEAKIRVDELEGSLKKKERHVAALQKQLAEKERYIVELGNSESDKIAELQKQLADKERCIAELGNAESDKIAELQKQLADKERYIAELGNSKSGKMAELQKQLADKERYIAELGNSESGKIAELNEQLADKEQYIEKLSKSESGKQQRIEELEKQLADKVTHGTSTVSDQDIEDLRRRHDMLQKNHDMLQKKVHAFEQLFMAMKAV